MCKTIIPTINTGGHGPGGASDLSREAGTFDSLRSLLDLVLVAAAMGSDHLTRPCLHMHCETERETHTVFSTTGSFTLVFNPTCDLISDCERV